MTFDTKAIISILVAVTSCVAFLATVFAPFFGVKLDANVQTLVFSLFSAMVGAGGTSVLISMGQAQAAKMAIMQNLNQQRLPTDRPIVH